MRTTLNLDEDLLFAIKEIAKRESRTAGQVASDLIRCSLESSLSAGPEGSTHDDASGIGFRPFHSSRGVVTNELVNRIRDEIGT